MAALCPSCQSQLLRHRRRYHCELLMPPLCPSGFSLVKSLITLAHEIIDSQKCFLPQRRNFLILSRRIGILHLLLEEVRNTASALLPSVVLCFSELHVVLQGVKLLSEDCAESSRICLLLEHRKMSEFFHRITQEIATALEILPLSLLDVSCDVCEQVELLMQQAKKAKLHVDAKETRLCADMRFVMGQIENKETPELSKLREIFDGLELKNAGDCERELERLAAEDVEGMREVVPARSVKEREVPLRDLVSFVRYCKCILYGATGTAIGTVSHAPSTQELEIIGIPDDFRCPISLELMLDPVVVATGQTYDRAEITKWIDGHNRTCPKSGLALAHTTLIPNYGLRNLIWQWCVQHNVQQLYTPMESSTHTSCSASPSTLTALETTKLTVEFLFQQLPSALPDTQCHIIGELGVLAKFCCDNCKVIADAGGIPLLIPFLSAANAHTKEQAVATMLNLSIYMPNKAQIVDAGALDHLIRLLERNVGVSTSARENAVAVLFSLSQAKETVMEMGRKPVIMEVLLQLLKSGNPRSKRVAASALFNMAITYPPNQAELVKAGMVEDLISMLSSTDRGGVEEEGTALLDVLTNSSEGRGAIAVSAMALLPLLVDLLRVGRKKSKENAASILLSMCRHGSHCLRAKVQMRLYGVVPLLHTLLNHGTPRARRKAGSLLHTLFH